MNFKQLNIGDRFAFTSEDAFPHSGMATGPWVKTGPTSYTHETDWKLSDCKVGTTTVEVKPLEAAPPTDFPNKLTLAQATVLLGKIKPHFRVTILKPNGKELEPRAAFAVLEPGQHTLPPRKFVQRWVEVTGHAVMHSAENGWVLNLGGRHGTPGLANHTNIVNVRAARKEPPPKPKLKRSFTDRRED